MRSARNSDEQINEQSSTALLTKALAGAKKIIASHEQVQRGQYNSVLGGMLLMSAAGSLVVTLRTGSWINALWCVVGGLIGGYTANEGIQNLYKGSCDEVEGKETLRLAELEAERQGLLETVTRPSM